jgi:hypothetical protein
VSFLSPALASALPADIQKAGPAAKKAYETGLGFEQMLLDQLSQELTKTVSNSDDGSSDSTGLLGSGSSGFASMLPQALDSSVMSRGGLGIAREIAASIDPSLRPKR